MKGSIKMEKDKIKKLIEIIQQIENHRPFPNYSGKMMYGKACWGTVASPNQVGFIATLCDKNDIAYSMDSMAFDRIIYFENLTFEEIEPVAKEMGYDRIHKIPE